MKSELSNLSVTIQSESTIVKMTRKEPISGKYTVLEAHVDLASDIRTQPTRSTSFERGDNAHFSGGHAFGNTSLDASLLGKKKNYFEILGVNHDCTGVTE